MSSLCNKIVLMQVSSTHTLSTGATSGIGEACALAFAAQGAHLILTGRRTERLQSLVKRLQAFPIQSYPLSCDIRDRSALLASLNTLPPAAKDIDVLVNNAGLVLGMDPIETVSDDAIDTMINTNVKGLLYATQAVLPGMKSRQRGHIINISSISGARLLLCLILAGTQVYPNGGVYCVCFAHSSLQATKHAVDALTRTLRLELVETPLRVTSIDPGLVETEFSVVRFGGDKARADAVYKGVQPLVAQDIAETVVFAASRPPHVQIASMVVFATHQAAVTTVHRKG